MTARDKFRIGQRVRLSADGKASFPRRGEATAIVIGFGRQPHLVRIRRDGCTSPEAYHLDFWEAIDGGSE